MSAEEKWRQVCGEPNYFVSSTGRFRHGEKLRNGTVNNHGYVMVRMPGRRQRTLHSVVAEAFIGPRPLGAEVRHLDDDKLNNAVENLAYGFRSQNAADRIVNGRDPNARKTHCAKGHPYDADNTYVWIAKNGRPHRKCRQCARVAKTAYKRRRRESR